MESWHAHSVEDVLKLMHVEPKHGLNDEEVGRRRGEHGPNQLQQVESRPWWKILLQQFRSIVVYLLGAAAVLAFATQRWPEGVAVLAVIIVNTLIGFVSEWKAVRSMAALREMGEHLTHVRREGRDLRVQAPEIVPGDIVLLEAGDLVPADLRLLSADHLRVNEAALTGESVPADKTPEPVSDEALLADRHDMLYKGTGVADGSAVGVAVSTGVETELGRISELAQRAEASATPLQKRLDRLGKRLAWLTIGIAVLVGAVGLLLRQQEATLVVETALALGIAAIPEGLPIVATIALARGMYRMAQRNALVNQLTAVETPGATRVIFSDKTGTLTENRMRLQKIVSPAAERSLSHLADDDASPLPPHLRRVLEVAVLCNGASLSAKQGEGQAKGDPTEVALLRGGEALGVARGELLRERPNVRTEEFDPRVKKMATFHESDRGLYVAVKGAPDAVLQVCDRIVTDDPESSQALEKDGRRQWLRHSEQLAAEGLRVLAAADKWVEREDASPYEKLRFVGLVGLLDPAREGVKEAIDRCQAAGIRVEMVTGDQAATAKAIAEAVGIIGDEDDPDAVVLHGKDLKAPGELSDRELDSVYAANIFARVSPEQKLNLVDIYQQQGEIVAMTGDGINDAPALKKADIGVAMGRRGTEAAKQVADMVLRDDSLETIVAAVEEGRVIFANIRKSVMFMLTTNVAEVMAVTVATLAGWPLPLLPLQILYLNVLTDVFPALALGVGPRSGQEMSEPPRDPRQAVLTGTHWSEITGLAGVLAACVLGGLWLGQHWLGLSTREAVTVSFLTIAFGKLWFTFGLRDPRSGMFRNEVTRNPWIWAAMLVCTALLMAAVYAPGLSQLLQTRVLDREAWGLAIGMSIIPALAAQTLRAVQRRRRRE